jgi:hypothetical protein
MSLPVLMIQGDAVVDDWEQVAGVIFQSKPSTHLSAERSALQSRFTASEFTVDITALVQSSSISAIRAPSSSSSD